MRWPQATLDKWVATNANLKRLDGSRRGYLALTLTSRQLRADLVTVDDATRVDAARGVAASYTVEAGNPAIHAGLIDRPYRLQSKQSTVRAGHCPVSSPAIHSCSRFIHTEDR